MAAMAVKADLSNLPANLSLLFLKGASLSLKSRQIGYKYFSEGYIHDVKLYRNADASSLSVSAKAYRSQRKREKPHALHLDLSPVEVTYAYCTCQAGINGTCSHIVGLITALQQWQLMGLTDIPAQLTCTSLPQQWAKPRGTKIEPEAVPQLTFVNPKPDRKRKPIENTLTDCRKIRVSGVDIDQLKTLDGSPISYVVSSPKDTVQTFLGAVPVASGLATHASFFRPMEKKVNSTKCGNLTVPMTPKVTLDKPWGDKGLSQDQCVKLERDTVGQSTCNLWVTERKGRLTASNFGLILKRKKEVTDKFLDTVTNNGAAFNSKSTSYGKNQEKNAIAKYVQKSGNHVHDCGLVVNPSFPFLAASPDSKVCENSKTGLLEVKCPYTARNMTIGDACALKDFCLQRNGDMISLNKNHNYYYQVQGQLLVTGYEFSDFVVFTQKDCHIERISADLEFMKRLLNDLFVFYLKYIKPSPSTNEL